MYENFREFGLETFLVLINIKFKRMKSMLKDSEKMEDSLLDLINYAILCYGYIQEKDSDA
jgi:hypothetical protein